MAESEKIVGNGVTRIFKELLQRKTSLKLILKDSDFQHQTIVTALKTQKPAPSFKIDTPEGFREAAADIETWHMRFEFSGKDKIKYIFDTVGGDLSDHQISIQLPEIVERIQRRRLFRINPPEGTSLCLTINATPYEFEVIDISLGGSLAVLVQADSHTDSQPPFPDIDDLKDVELIFPEEIYRKPLRIKKATVRRIKKDSDALRYEMALEFTEMSGQEEKRLTGLIYRLQRQYLRKRLPLDI